MHLKSLTYGLWGLLIHWMEGSSPATANEFTCCQGQATRLFALKEGTIPSAPFLGAGQCAEQSFDRNHIFHKTSVEEGIETMT